MACPPPYDIPDNCECHEDTLELFCLVDNCGDIAEELFTIVAKLTVYGTLCEEDIAALMGLYTEKLTLADDYCYGLPNCQR